MRSSGDPVGRTSRMALIVDDSSFGSDRPKRTSSDFGTSSDQSCSRVGVELSKRPIARKPNISSEKPGYLYTFSKCRSTRHRQSWIVPQRAPKYGTKILRTGVAEPILTCIRQTVTVWQTFESQDVRDGHVRDTTRQQPLTRHFNNLAPRSSAQQKVDRETAGTMHGPSELTSPSTLNLAAFSAATRTPLGLQLNL